MHRPSKICVAATIYLLAALAAAAQSVPPKRVLVLMPFQTSRASSVAILRGMEAGLKAKYGGSVDIVTDNIAPIPPEPAGFSQKISEWLAYKYGQQQIDAIVAVTSPAIAYAEALRDQLWPNIPLLLLLQEEDRRQFPQDVRRSARVMLALSSRDTVRSALLMMPSTQHLAFLEGSSEVDRQGNQEILQNLRQAYPDLDIIEIAGLSWDETRDRVKSLPDNSIILLASFLSDRKNRELTLSKQVEDLAAMARAPVFTDIDVAMGYGIVGGSVLSVEAAGVAVGEQLAELLKGVDPDTLASRRVENSFIVDWRQMKRWDISERSLPPNATILYRQPSVWEQYQRYIVAFLTVLALLLFLVAFLLFERQRRKKEEGLNSAMLESLPGMALLVSPQGEILRTNQLQADAHQHNGDHSAAALPGRQYVTYLRQLVGPEELHEVGPIEQVVAGSRSGATAEFPVATEDRWLEVRALQLPNPQSGSLIVHLDITQRKHAELERLDSRAEIFHLNRVAAMGQLAASLAHELSQPLAAIMSNAEAAQRFANRSNPDMQEIREALDDITRDDRRARSVIQGMRSMLKKQHVALEPVDLNQVAANVAQMVRNEATLRGMVIELTLSPHPSWLKATRWPCSRWYSTWPATAWTPWPIPAANARCGFGPPSRRTRE